MKRGDQTSDSFRWTENIFWNLTKTMRKEWLSGRVSGEKVGKRSIQEIGFFNIRRDGGKGGDLRSGIEEGLFRRDLT